MEEEEQRASEGGSERQLSSAQLSSALHPPLTPLTAQRSLITQRQLCIERHSVLAHCCELCSALQ